MDKYVIEFGPTGDLAPDYDDTVWFHSFNLSGTASITSYRKYATEIHGKQQVDKIITRIRNDPRNGFIGTPKVIKLEVPSAQ